MKLKIIIMVCLLIISPVVVLGDIHGLPWSEITELTPNDNANDEYPASAVYNNKLYVVWQSDNNIAMKSFDGVSWSSIVKISNSASEYINRYPQLAVYDNKLYIVWETNDVTLSNGTDFDIVIKCYDDGYFSNPVEITDKYDNVDDYNPQIAVWNNELYVVWQSSNNLVIRNYSINGWGETENITSSKANNYAAQISVYNDNLCVLWVTEDADISSGSDSDIVMKYKNECIEITPENDNAVDQHPQMAVYNNNLYIVWQTNNPEITDSEDDDIVIRSYNASIGLGSILELTSNDVSDFGPEIIVYDKLYIVWLRDSKELMIKAYNGYIFDNAICVKSMLQGFILITKSCSSSCIYNNKLYIIWQTRDDSMSDGDDWDIVSVTYDKGKEQGDVLNDKEERKWFIPGFEMLYVVGGLGIYVILSKQKRKKM